MYLKRCTISVSEHLAKLLTNTQLTDHNEIITKPDEKALRDWIAIKSRLRRETAAPKEK